ncbi:MAG: PAS domain S-box protein, partial [Bacteroidota bacterium]
VLCGFFCFFVYIWQLFSVRFHVCVLLYDEVQFLGLIGVVEDFSDRLAAEQALEESEDRFKSFAENLPGMVYIKHPAGTHVYGNHENLAFHQVEMEAYQTKTAWDFLDPELAKFVEEIDVKVIESQTSSRIDFFMKERDQWIQEYKFPIGQHLIGSFAMDITAQKKAELALKRSEEQYRNITNSVPGAVLQYRLQPNGEEEVIFSNQAAKDLAGIARLDNNPNLQRLWRLVLPEDLPDLVKSIQESATKLKFWNHEWRIHDADGRLRWLNGRGVPRTMKDGTILWHSLILDITKKVSTHAALQESEAQLRSIAEHIGEVVWLRAAESREVLFVNQAFDTLTGYSIENVYENSDFFFDLIPTSEQEKAAKALAHYRKTGIYNEEHQIIRADGTRRWVWVRLFPIRNEKEEIISHTGLAVDISKRKEAEVIRQRMEHLEARNQEMEQFTYVASHDMQEPLRTIISFAGLLDKRHRQDLPLPAREYLQFIYDAAHRMNDLIRELLDYSRLGKGRITAEVDCAELIQSVLQDLHATIQEAEAEIMVEGAPRVLGVERELRQLFQNLISNAIKFRFKDIPPVIRIFAQEEEEFWQFGVQDNGIGIPQKYQDRIFHLFQRLNHRDQYDGTGIGLAHCRKIVELHYGEIWVESEPEAGTTFFFTIRKSQPVPVGELPIAEAEVSPQE